MSGQNRFLFCMLFKTLLLHVLCPITGCVQDLLAAGEVQRDLSGNPILKDSGVWLRNEIKSHFKDADIKYIDPSYLIRSIPTISGDRIYCKASPRSSSCHNQRRTSHLLRLRHLCWGGGEQGCVQLQRRRNA